MNHTARPNPTKKEVNKMPQSTFDWAIEQIQTRLDEVEELNALISTGKDNARYDTLEERTEFTMQEIMKIAFRAQLGFDLEDGASGLDSGETVLEIIHYLTGDPSDIEIIVRS